MSGPTNETGTTPPTASWAILRQLVIATPDPLADGALTARRWSLPAGFADPALAEIGLHDHVMPVGPQKYLEFVGPVDSTSYINRWLSRGGPGGYCLSVQVPDVPACRARAQSGGVRLAADVVLMGHQLIQLHPADVGVLLELDGVTDPGVWFWDDVTPGPRSDATIVDIVAVTVGSPDPQATARQWAQIIGISLVSPTSVDFSGVSVEFSEHPVGRLLAAEFLLAAGAEPPADTSIFGLDVRFRRNAATIPLGSQLLVDDARPLAERPARLVEQRN